MRRIIVIFTLIWPIASPAFAWNALGHKVVCEIAWRQLDEETRQRIVATLRRHPRYDQDFAKDLPAVDNDELIFRHAGTWPDIARSIRGPDRERFDHPIWHYVNFPITLGDFPDPGANRSTDPNDNKSVAWNVSQALQACLIEIKSDAPPEQKAVAYCWIFHLVGDLHQPLHTVALYSERFPRGDKGGNEIRCAQRGNLHALWDGLLGRRHEPGDVMRECHKLSTNPALWKVDTSGSVDDWIAESRELAKSFVYSSEILDAVAAPGELMPIALPESYLREAGSHAQARIVAAGLRLGSLLGGDPDAADDAGEPDGLSWSVFPPAPARSTTPIHLAPESAAAPATSGYWLNTSSGVRHNSSCRNYGATKRGRYCTADEGTPCGICGG